MICIRFAQLLLRYSVMQCRAVTVFLNGKMLTTFTIAISTSAKRKKGVDAALIATPMPQCPYFVTFLPIFPKNIKKSLLTW